LLGIFIDPAVIRRPGNPLLVSLITPLMLLLSRYQRNIHEKVACAPGSGKRR